MESAIIKGFGLGLLLSISVGPIVFTIIKLSLKQGKRAGYAFIAGVSFSDFLLVVVGNMAAEWVRSALKYENYIAIAGASLLIGMGVYSLFFGKDPVMDNSELPPSLRKRDMAKFVLQGFFINILNPAPIFFWLTTCTAVAYLPLNERLVLFSASLLMVFVTDILKVKLAGRLRLLLTPRLLHNIHHISAIILIVFGVAIAGGIFYNWYTH